MIVFSGSVPIGALWTGQAAVWWGIDVVMASSAALCFVAGVLAMATGLLGPRGIPDSVTFAEPTPDVLA